MRLASCITKNVLSIAMLVGGLFQSGFAREPGSVELGLDAGVSSVWDNGLPEKKARLAIAMPEQNLRVGIFATELMQFEPALSFALISTQRTPGSEERTTNYALGFGVGIAAHLSQDWTTFIPFVKVEPALLVVAAQSAELQFAVEVGGGLKLPLGSSWAGRIELSGSYAFERERKLPDVAAVSLKFGFSYFTK